jgi:hypothetical protein
VRRLVRPLEIVALPTIGLAIALAVAPGRAELALHVWLLVVLAVSLVAVVRAVRASVPRGPSLFDAGGGAPASAPERYASLEKLERSVSMATASDYDVHHRLRPVLRETAAALLLVRRGIDLDRQPHEAREALGETAFDLVRAGRERPDARRGAGIAPEELESVVSALEAI